MDGIRGDRPSRRGSAANRRESVRIGIGQCRLSAQGDYARFVQETDVLLQVDIEAAEAIGFKFVVLEEGVLRDIVAAVFGAKGISR